MLIPRRPTAAIHQRLDHYPAVALVGPRQAGKTTLARTFSTTYFDLEQEEDRLCLDLEWDRVLQEESLVVLDEGRFPVGRSITSLCSPSETFQPGGCRPSHR